jgi:hypothetical protein
MNGGNGEGGNGNGNGDGTTATASEGKENKGSSAVDSEKSNSGGDLRMTADGSCLASSPVPAVATPA